MFDNTYNQIKDMLKGLDLEGMTEKEVYGLRLAFDQCFNKGKQGTIDLKYAYDIVTNTNVVIFEWALDIDIPTIYVSENVGQFGFKPEDFYDGALKDYWAFVHPDDREAIREGLYEARRLGAPYIHAYRIITKSGEVRWVEERIIYERDGQGVLTHEKGILIDVTQMKVLQEKVKSSEERYKRIFENSSVIILTTDLKGKITAVNNLFKKTLGFEGKEVIDTYLQDYMVNEASFLSLKGDQDRLHQESFDIEFIKQDKARVILNLSCKSIGSLDKEIEIVGVDVSQKKIDEQRIRYLSYHDKLTDVYNRAYFDQMFRLLDQDKQYPFSIIIGDMNGLKELNDNYGHKKGDTTLKRIANIFRQACREEDIVCRIGGDEFAIICPGSDAEGAQAICQRIRNRCTEDAKYLEDPPSIALGFASKLDDSLSMDDLFKLADDQMYKNKMTYKKSTSGMYIGALQMMLEKNSYETKLHTKRMQELGMSLGACFNLSPAQMDDLNLVALMHDIGKIGIPNDLLTYEGPLTEAEYTIVKGHAYIGYSILESVPATRKLAEYILYHHENYDGSGYPEGLKGEEIPLISRIIRLVDAYDVMIHGTVYQEKKKKKDVIEEIKSLAGQEFDPQVVEKFMSYIQ